jgi:hypothetical protein
MFVMRSTDIWQSLQYEHNTMIDWGPDNCWRCNNYPNRGRCMQVHAAIQRCSSIVPYASGLDRNCSFMRVHDGVAFTHGLVALLARNAAAKPTPSPNSLLVGFWTEDLGVGRHADLESYVYCGDFDAALSELEPNMGNPCWHFRIDQHCLDRARRYSRRFDEVVFDRARLPNGHDCVYQIRWGDIPHKTIQLACTMMNCFEIKDDYWWTSNRDTIIRTVLPALCTELQEPDPRLQYINDNDDVSLGATAVTDGLPPPPSRAPPAPPDRKLEVRALPEWL